MGGYNSTNRTDDNIFSTGPKRNRNCFIPMNYIEVFLCANTEVAVIRIYTIQPLLLTWKKAVFLLSQ